MSTTGQNIYLDLLEFNNILDLEFRNIYVDSVRIGELEVSKQYGFVKLLILGDPKCNFSQFSPIN